MSSEQKKEEEKNTKRQPLVSVLGHVDHGKTTLLDKIRGTTVTSEEAGKITQHIGATEIPMEAVKDVCGPLADKYELNLPGLLFIDTPGHKAFTSLRDRGGSLADLAILVVDVNEGFQPQTLESIEILRRNKTPFIVAANKIDRISGWREHEGKCYTETLKEQRKDVQNRLQNKIYELIGDLHDNDFSSNLFNEVTDFRKEIAVVPVSAITGEGIPELLMMLTGLAQRYVGDELKVKVEGPARGTVLEVKEEKGMGSTIDTIIYDGTLSKDHSIVLGGKNGPIATKIKSILKPKRMDEIRSPEKKFEKIDEIHAAAGVKISAPDLDEALAGSPLIACKNEEEVKEAETRLSDELDQIQAETKSTGVIIKADTLGTLEAFYKTTEEENIPVKKAKVGDITKSDVITANTIKEKEEKLGVIFAFGVGITDDAKEFAEKQGIKIFYSNVIYEIMESYEEWKEELVEKKIQEKLESVTHPGKIRVIPDDRYIFRSRNPAIVGVEVLNGKIKVGNKLIKDEQKIGKIKSIKSGDEFLDESTSGEKVAVSITNVTIGRQIKLGDVLFTDVTEKDYKVLREYQDRLPEHESEVLNEIVEKKREKDSLWGVM